MTESAPEPSPRPGPAPASNHRTTGEPAVDEALAGLDDLGGRPLGEHHDRLSRAHEALHQVLQSPADTPDGRP